MKDKEDWIKFFALGCEFFASFILSLALVIQGDERGEAIAVIVLSIVVSGVVYIISAIVYIVGYSVHFVYQKKKCSTKRTKFWLYSISTFLGGLFYLVGDNLPPVMEEYGSQLGCGGECLQGVQAAGFVFLATAVIIGLPTVVHKTFTKLDKKKSEEESESGEESESDEDSNTVRFRVLNFVATLADLDLVYTSIERMYSSVCPSNSIVIGAWFYWAIYVLTFLVFLLLTVNIHTKCKMNWDTGWSNFHSILVFICLSTYLLADNRLPLSCTGAAVDNAILHSQVRIGLWVPALLIISYALVFSCGWVCFFRKRAGTVAV